MHAIKGEKNEESSEKTKKNECKRRNGDSATFYQPETPTNRSNYKKHTDTHTLTHTHTYTHTHTRHIQTKSKEQKAETNNLEEKRMDGVGVILLIFLPLCFGCFFLSREKKMQ